MPIPSLLNKGIVSMMSKAESSNKVHPVKEDALMLFRHPHPFKEELLMSVTGKVADANNISLTGTFLSNVYEGEFRDTGKAISKMKAYVKDKGLTASKYYVHYAYCPTCSKEAGTNYIVVFAHVESL